MTIQRFDFLARKGRPVQVDGEKYLPVAVQRNGVVVQRILLGKDGHRIEVLDEPMRAN